MNLVAPRTSSAPNPQRDAELGSGRRAESKDGSVETGSDVITGFLLVLGLTFVLICFGFEAVPMRRTDRTIDGES